MSHAVLISKPIITDKGEKVNSRGWRYKGASFSLSFSFVGYDDFFLIFHAHYFPPQIQIEYS